MKNFIFLLSINSILMGCGASTARLVDQPITASNYQNSIDIKKLDKTYYSAKYEGKNLGCTQNDGFESCHEPFLTIREEAPGKWSRTFKDINAVFKKEKPIEAESFRAKIAKSSKSGEGLELAIPGGKPREFLLLALADLSLQRGFKYLVELEGMSGGSCMSSQRAETFGTFDQRGTFYRGTTKLSTDSYCHYIETVEVLMLNDRVQLAKGIFYTGTDPDKLFIEDRLYAGAPGFYHPAYIGVQNEGESHFTYLVPIKAWEKVYDASGLSKDLRLKYGVTSTKPYTFEDEKESKKKRKAEDVIEKNLVK